MKASRLNLYIEMCECLHEEPTIEGVKFYDRCVTNALREIVGQDERTITTTEVM